MSIRFVIQIVMPSDEFSESDLLSPIITDILQLLLDMLKDSLDLGNEILVFFADIIMCVVYHRLDLS